MSATIRETTFTRNVGRCPACGDRIRAEVTVATEVRDPFWPDVADDSKPTTVASCRVVAADVWEHHCDKREGGDE